MRFSSVAVTTLLAVTLAGPAAAQSARATGTVRDTSGRALKGATVRATNPDAYPPEFTAVTDDRGRWAMIGLRTGTWTFVAEAEGFKPVLAEAQMRVAGTAPLTFTLERAPGPPPNALEADVQERLAAAQALRDEGRLDQAITAYRTIQARNPRLTTIGLVVADLYRRKAALETDPAERQALFERAIASYEEVLAGDTAHDRARAEIEATRAQAAAAR